MNNTYQRVIMCLLMCVLFLPIESRSQSTIARGLKRIYSAYPGKFMGIEHNKLVWKDGFPMVYDDGIKEKDFDTKLNFPDLEDQMFQKYPPTGTAFYNPTRDHDPGRIRYDPFFKKMYGKNKQEVEAHLTTVKWLPKIVNQSIKITKINQIHEKLSRISKILEKLPKENLKFVNKLGGTYHWRTIAKTRRLSPHSYGIAIDINPAYGDYWKWHDPQKPLIYKNQIPHIIVRIFEEHGFIWGGRWFHYDTFHFEYRPELLLQQ